MTNEERWLEYTSGLPSPDNFIEWSFLYLISASLQRRVWTPPDHDRVYPNMYITLVGDPGVGKGGPIRAVSSILTEHKLEDHKDTSKFKGDEKVVADAVIDNDIKVAQEDMVKGKNKDASIEKALLIPVAADAVTYEALIQSMSYCLRRINYLKTEPDGKQRMAIYSHSSQCFCLEEIASLFRKHQNDLVNFLIQAYDCGESYEYRTKTAGRDRILRICVNFLGGTTPDFMQETFDDALVNQGYSSRTFYIYGHKNRKSVFFRPELTEAQRGYRKELSAHVKALTKLYGQIRIDQSTMDWLTRWKEDFDAKPEMRTAKSPKMKAFWARMNIHVMKVAMAKHFSESLEMYIPLETFKWAIDFIMHEANSMQLALTVGGDNPLAKSSAKVYEYLVHVGKKTFKELLAQFWEKLRKTELEEVLNYLQQVDQVYCRQITDNTTGETHIYYHAKE
jgi:hypothetical protein